MQNQKLILALLFVFISFQFRNSYGQNYTVNVPATVSADWQAYLITLTDPSLIPAFPAPGDIVGWRKLYESKEIVGKARLQAAINRFHPEIGYDTLSGVAVLNIKPKGWKDNGKVLIYLHGGAYTLLSAESTLNISALIADYTGLRVISVNYTCAPKGKWNTVIDEVIKVVQALIKKGYTLNDIAIFGDSAGGGLAAGSVLKMRDLGLGMPAAIVLWSPWADVTENGDTYSTLKNEDPVLSYANILKSSADAYANPEDQKNPYVSPVYGDYSKGFPPTLIQGGTKEIFLSNFVRLYQAIDNAGVYAKLDLYEGMIHNFQVHLPDSPESKLALKKTNDFLKTYLRY